MKFKIVDKKRFAMFVGVVVLILAAIAFSVWFFFFKKVDPYEQLQSMTMKEAAAIGEKKTMKMLVQINNPSGEETSQRGDVLMTAPEDRQFSIAEEQGFLIVKIALTDKQAELLALPKEKKKKDIKEGEPKYEQILQRKFYVDLEKIGISKDEIRGKVIDDKIFESDILKEKK